MKGIEMEEAEQRINAIIENDSFTTSNPEAVTAVLDSLRAALDHIRGGTEGHDILVQGDSIQVNVNGNRVYVWWRTKHIARVTIIARYQGTIMLDMKDGVITEVKE